MKGTNHLGSEGEMEKAIFIYKITAWPNRYERKMLLKI